MTQPGLPLSIREETPQDREAIREVNRRAFQTETEGELVDRLRAEGLVIASLVASVEGRVVGHILFSKVVIETGERAVTAASLAPMAVVPEMQRRGVGSALVRLGLELCRQRGYSLVLVVGHTSYYPRFGFSAGLAKALHSPYSGESFMALDLTGEALPGLAGTVTYPEAFRSAE